MESTLAPHLETCDTRELPMPRPELVLRPVGHDGRHVVKNPLTGEYFQLRAPEAFLFEQLAGRQAAADICRSFERQFGEPLSAEDLDQFLELLRSRHLLR